MLQSSDDVLYAVKLHLAANRRCSCGNKCGVASLVRGHYRSELGWSDKHLDDARASLRRLYTALDLVEGLVFVRNRPLILALLGTDFAGQAFGSFQPLLPSEH